MYSSLPTFLVGVVPGVVLVRCLRALKTSGGIINETQTRCDLWVKWLTQTLQSFNLQKRQAEPKPCGWARGHLSSLPCAPQCGSPSVYYQPIDLFAKSLRRPLNIHRLFFPPSRHHFILKSNLSPWVFISRVPLTSCRNMKANPFHH